MAKTVVKAVIIASISASIALLISQDTSTFQSALTVPMTAWILYQFSGYERIWKSLGNFQNPVLFSINGFFATFTYYSWKQTPFWNTFYISLGAFLVAGAVSLLIFKYWTMGD